jgi:hypothetical protein
MQSDLFRLTVCISKESDRKKLIGQHFALNGNPSGIFLCHVISRVDLIRKDREIPLRAENSA